MLLTNNAKWTNLGGTQIGKDHQSDSGGLYLCTSHFSSKSFALTCSLQLTKYSSSMHFKCKNVKSCISSCECTKKKLGDRIFGHTVCLRISN